MRIGRLTSIMVMAGAALSPISPTSAQEFYYRGGVPHIPAPARNYYGNSSSCVPYWTMPFSYINDCAEYIPSTDDWNSPGRG